MRPAVAGWAAGLALAAPAAWAGTATDAQGTVHRVETAHCIITLGAGVAETVDALGRSGDVCAADASVAAYAPLAAKVRLPYHRQLSAEGLLAQGPDLVLADAASGPPAALQQVAAAGVPVFVVDDTHTVAAAAARAETLGALLDADGPGLAARIHAEVAAAQALPVAPGQRVLFVYARGAGTLMVAGTGTAAHEMITLAGADNALGDSEGWAPLTPEAVVGAQPTALLLTTTGLASVGGAAGLRAQPGLSLLGEVPVLDVDDLLLLGFGPRTGAGLAALRRALARP